MIYRKWEKEDGRFGLSPQRSSTGLCEREGSVVVEYILEVGVGVVDSTYADTCLSASHLVVLGGVVSERELYESSELLRLRLRLRLRRWR